MIRDVRMVKNMYKNYEFDGNILKGTTIVMDYRKKTKRINTGQELIYMLCTSTTYVYNIRLLIRIANFW